MPREFIHRNLRPQANNNTSSLSSLTHYYMYAVVFSPTRPAITSPFRPALCPRSKGCEGNSRGISLLDYMQRQVYCAISHLCTRELRF